MEFFCSSCGKLIPWESFPEDQQIEIKAAMDDLCYISFDEKSSNFPYTSRIVEMRNVEHFGDHDTYSCAYYGINAEVFKLYRNAHVLFTVKDGYVPCKVEYQKFDSFNGAHLFRIHVRADIRSKEEEKKYDRLY